MTQYRKKPIVVEGVRFDGTNHDEIVRFAGLKAKVQGRERALYIITEEGPLKAQPGDTIIRGAEGEFYPVKASVFPKTFEVIDQPGIDSEHLATRLEGFALNTKSLASSKCMFQAASHIRSLHKALAGLVEQIDLEQGIMTHDHRVNSKLWPTLDNAIDLLRHKEEHSNE